ncbi:hypothetical protein [Paraburkholderia sp. HD33-4]|uniref:hypothetical protein n=1 Tax=Paraburkholderia sp. HD33-4 TaxID=2883242 RepID=UPI001F1A0676|nr:hypothetical protein [Paraburkholderia sp. HD33-4]
MADTISIREFARREGVSDTLVHFALKEGRLTRAGDGRMDPALVGTRWRASATSNDDAKLPLQAATEPAKGVAYGEALRLKENWLALLRRIEYEQKSGSLVELAVAQDVLFDVFRSQRDAWLSWSERVAPLIASELGVDDTERLTRILHAHVLTQVRSFGEPSSDIFVRHP